MSDSKENTGSILRTIKILIGLFMLFLIFVVIRGGILEHMHKTEQPRKKREFYLGLVNDSTKKVKVKGFHHYFKGVVLKIKRFEPKKQGEISKVYLKVRLLESTVAYFRKPETFCIIDFPFAEIMFKDYGDSQLGDTVFFNGHSDCFGIKQSNKKWFTNYRPDIAKYSLLNPPHSTLPKYDSLELEDRKKNYPVPLNVPPEKINFYWENYCGNEQVVFDSLDYGLKFYMPTSKTDSTKIEPPKKPPYFYILQVDEYKEPLDIEKLKLKYRDEPIIWVKQNETHKYFINRKMDTEEEAVNYLNDFIMKNPEMEVYDYPIIRKLKRKQPPKVVKKEQFYEEDKPEVITIPYKGSYLNYAWLFIMIFVTFHVTVQWISVSGLMQKNKAFAKGFRQYAMGMLLLFNLWLLTIGIGIVTEMADSIFDFMLNKGKAIVIISNVYLLIFLFIGTIWVFFKSGADVLAALRGYAGGIFSPAHSSDGVKLIWIGLVSLGMAYIFARLLF